MLIFMAKKEEKVIEEEDQESALSETRERESKEKSIYVKVSDETRNNYMRYVYIF